ncbi:MAG: SIMPL domain-containing protein [Candidatus Obscuribacterales bacterium]
MKTAERYIIHLMSTLMVLSVCHPSGAQEKIETKTITTIGKSKIMAEPDRLLIIAAVDTHGKKLSATHEENERKVKAVLAVANKYKIPEQKVQTGGWSIQPSYKDGDYIRKNIEGFNVDKRISFQVDDLKTVTPLINDILEAGANKIENIQFQLTDERKYADEARILAIRAAREKASAIAAELGMKLGDAVKVVEEKQMDPYRTNLNAISSSDLCSIGDPEDGEHESLAPGQIAVNVVLSATFEMQKE